MSENSTGFGDMDDAHLVAAFQNKYDSDMQEDISNGNRPRLLENLDLFVGVNGRQWGDGVAAELEAQGRPANTYNIIQQITESVLGNLEQKPTDIRFQSLAEDDKDKVDILQSLFEYDYELGNWEYVKLQFKRDGLCHTGIMQMYVDKSCDFRGQLALRNIHPAHAVVDPWWQTDDIRDIRRVSRAEWLDAEQLIAAYPDKADEIRERVSRDSMLDPEYNTAQVDKVADRSVEWYDTNGARYKVIETTYMVDEDYISAVSLVTGQEDEEMTQKVNTAKGEARTTLMAMASEEFDFIPSSRRRCKVFACAPGLSMSLVLAKGDYPLQTGMVPYAIFSYRSFYGFRMGLPDLLKDAQRSFNKRRSQVGHILAQAGNNNWVIESDAFKDPAGIDDFTSRQSLGGQVFEVRPGSIKEQKIRPLERMPIPQDLMYASDSELNIMYQLTSITPAMQGRGETDRESGVLNEQKTQQSIIALDMISKTLKRCDQILADMYFKAAKQLYGKVKREIVDRRNHRKIVINQREFDPRTGSVALTNTISDLDRYLVDVVETRIGPGRRAMELMKLGQMLPALTNPMIRAQVELQIFELMEVPEEQKAQAREATTLFVQNQIAQLQAGNAQAEMVVKQASAPPPAPTAPAPQGAPAPAMM